jgi:hypothetical protein
MATKSVRAIAPGIYGVNQEYRETGVVFEIDLKDGDALPAWVEEVKATTE